MAVKMNKTILYIISDVRSGSTMIENVLSKSDNIVSVGELHHLDSHIHKGKWGKTWGWKCSCGENIEKCDFWLSIVSELRMDLSHIDKTQMTMSNSENQNLKTAKLLNDIYTAIFSVKDCELIIDSSKKPFQGINIYRNSIHNVKFLFVTRDLRAIAISKNKWSKKFFDTKKELSKVLINTWLYKRKCLKYLKSVPNKDVLYLSYEGFCNNPQKELNNIMDFCDLKTFKMPEYMFLENDHTIGGTPSRFEKRKIKLDANWKIQALRKPVFNALGFILNKL